MRSTIGTILMFIGCIVCIVAIARMFGGFRDLIPRDLQFVAVLFVGLALFFVGAITNESARKPKNKYDARVKRSSIYSGIYGLVITLFVIGFLLAKGSYMSRNESVRYEKSSIK